MAAKSTKKRGKTSKSTSAPAVAPTGEPTPPQPSRIEDGPAMTPKGQA